MVVINSPKHVGLIAIAAGIIGILVLTVAITFQFAGKSIAETTPESGTSIKGTVVCLPHKDTSGVQTLECAFGIKDEKGKHYGLKDTDRNYRNISALPTGKDVRVYGTLGASLDARYDTVGTIEVSRIDKL